MGLLISLALLGAAPITGFVLDRTGPTTSGGPPRRREPKESASRWSPSVKAPSLIAAAS